jgi:hypothetical protein
MVETPRRNTIKETTSVVLMLEAGHQIIRIAHDDHIAVGLLPAHQL